MTKQTLAAAVLALCGFAASSAHAADGTITITGSVSGTTCTISGGTGASPGSGANFPVVLDRVQTSALKAAGDTAGAKRYFVYVGGSGGCPDGTKVAVRYEPTSPGINPATGNLRNTATATPASRVEVQILDGASNTGDLAVLRTLHRQRRSGRRGQCHQQRAVLGHLSLMQPG